MHRVVCIIRKTGGHPTVSPGAKTEALQKQEVKSETKLQTSWLNVEVVSQNPFARPGRLILVI